MIDNIIDPNCQPWMFIPFLIFIIGYIKLCVYFEKQNENHDETYKSKE